MEIFDLFRNYVNTLVGRNQEFEQLLSARDIDGVKSKMNSRVKMAMEAIKEYDVRTHEIMKRQDKIITDKKGNFIRKEPVWKLPIPYPVYINEVAVVFIYGQPVKWTQISQDTEKAFAKFQEVIKSTRFDSRIRQCKRIAGAETESAMLFRVFKNEDGTADVQIRVLARSKGDEIYTRFDQYENLISVAWGYYVKEEKDEVVYHFDIFTPKIIYRCAKRSIGWEVTEETNFIGKIPIILFQQEKEWKGVEPLIYREEYIASHTADTNDYFADPIMIMSAESIKNAPEKKEIGKLLITNDRDGVDKVAKYLTWDSAPQSKQAEVDWLQDQILSKTFTPRISLDTLSSLGNLSGKALRTVMMLADIKASRQKEIHDELLDRTASLITSIIGNVLDVSLKGECDKLVVAHAFQEPFGEDIQGGIENIIRCVDAGIMSAESAIEDNPIVRDIKREKDRLKEEKATAEDKQADIFGSANVANKEKEEENEEDQEQEQNNSKQ